MTGTMLLSQQYLPRHPPSVDWWVTSKCNLSCDYCFGPTKSYQDEHKHRKSILSALCKSNTPIVTLCGGEPLTVIDLPQIAHDLTEAGKRVVLNTNGQLLTPDLLVCTGLYYNLYVIGISLDGPNQLIYSAMRGENGFFSKAIKAAALVKSVPRILLKIATCASAINIDHLESLSDIVADLSPFVWRIYQFTPRSRGADAELRHCLPFERLQQAFNRIHIRHPRLRISLCSSVRADGCFIIAPDGNVLQPAGITYKIIGSCIDNDIDLIWRNRTFNINVIMDNKSWHCLTEG